MARIRKLTYATAILPLVFLLCGASLEASASTATMVNWDIEFENIFAVQSEGASRAQTFTPQIDGFLGSIELTLDIGGPVPLGDRIELQLRGTDAGVPGGVSAGLGSVIQTRAELGDFQNPEVVLFDFTSMSIPVFRGVTLAFVLGPETGGALKGAPINASRPNRDFYPEGTAFYSENFEDTFVRSDFDYLFRFTVVPEPSPLLLMAMGLVGLASVRSVRGGGGSHREESLRFDTPRD